MREPSVSEELFRLVELRNQGVLTDEEFQIEKAKVLGKSIHPPEQTASNTSEPPRRESPAHSAPRIPPKKTKDKNIFRPNIFIALIMLFLGVAVALAVIFLNPHKQREEAMQQQSSSPQTALPASAVLPTATIPATTDHTNQQPAAASSPNPVAEAQAQQALEAAQARYDRADNAINQLWQGLDAEVRNQLRDDQNAFNQSKENRCNQMAAASGGNETVRQTINLNCQAEANENRVSTLRDAAHAVQPQLLQRRLEEARTNNAEALNEFGNLNDRMPQTVREQLQDELQTWLATTRSQCNLAPAGNGDATETAIAGLNCFTKALQEKNAKLRQYVI